MQIKPALLLAAIAALPLPAQAGLFSKNNARVIVDSWARPEFLELRQGADGLQPMSYHFMEGRYFGGFIADGSLKRVPLQSVAQSLADAMREQEFYPAASRTEGDLLIIVHWGVTGVEDDWNEMFGADAFGSDADSEDFDGGGSSFTDADYFDNSTAHSDAANAKLIGFDKAFRRKGLTPWELQDLREMLREERYFIILMAYDFHRIRNEKKAELVWTTRFSLPSIGTNFEEAYPALARAATPYFATNLDDIAKSRTHLGKGDTSASELEVIGEVKDEEEPGSKKKPQKKK